MKIAHFKSRHIYIDLDNKADHITIWTKQRMFIDGQLMRLQLWTPTFRPEEETSIVLVWVNLPEPSWHCYYIEVIYTLLAPMGKALYLESTSIQKTRDSVAKVRVRIDITKDRPQHVWLRFEKEDLFVGK